MRKRGDIHQNSHELILPFRHKTQKNVFKEKNEDDLRKLDKFYRISDAFLNLDNLYVNNGYKCYKQIIENSMSVAIN